MHTGEAPDFSLGIHGELRFDQRLYVPQYEEARWRLLDEVHRSKYTVHPGSTKMYRELKRNFWWPGMKREVADYVARCVTCQLVKAEHQRPGGTLQPLSISEWKWEHISMDFVTGLPCSSRKNDTVWVIVDRLTKLAHFLAIRVNLPLRRLAELYVSDIVRLHGVPIFIVSDRDTRFTLRYWRTLQEAFGTVLNFNTVFHPQLDG